MISNIFPLTITGIDDRTDLDRFVKLLEKYNATNFVEWGVLFSQAKQGTGRYPNFDFLKDLKNLADQWNLKISAHLCGKWVRDLVGGEFTFIKENPIDFLDVAQRIQLNMVDAMFMSLDPKVLMKTINQHSSSLTPSCSVILQTKRPFERSKEMSSFDMLFDVSGGHGVSPSSWPEPADKIYCGYAGGFGPENLAERLQLLSKLVNNRMIWVDMETKVRDENDNFDLDKVEECISIYLECQSG